jgi:RNA polymerase sigma-70 factor (ECF subfamily)
MAKEELELLASAKRGESAAVEKLLAQYEPRIFRFGLRMCGNEQDAKEVLQETLIAAFKGLHQFRQEASLSTWLFQIARSFCIKERRGPKVEQVSIDSPESRALPETGAAPDETAHARQIGQQLQEAIASLSDSDREVIVLRDVEGLSAEEAAEVVGIEVRALKSRLHRARNRLREKLSGILGDVSEGNSPCPELAETLAAYTTEDIDVATCTRIEEHMAQCPRCAHACEELKASVSLCRAIPGGEVPRHIQDAVRQSLQNA